MRDQQRVDDSIIIITIDVFLQRYESDFLRNVYNYKLYIVHI